MITILRHKPSGVFGTLCGLWARPIDRDAGRLAIAILDVLAWREGKPKAHCAWPLDEVDLVSASDAAPHVALDKVKGHPEPSLGDLLS